MITPVRAFEVVPGANEHVPLLVGLMGGPSAGKTYSSLTMAAGMRLPGMGKPVLIDTEGGRSKAFCRKFDFDRIDFEPPFRPLHFLDAVKAALAKSPCAIIIDSMSDEHEGTGGVLQWHEEVLWRMAGADYDKRMKCTQAAWIEVKASRRDMLSGLRQIKTPMIFNFRAREKTKPLKNAAGKVEPTNIGWQPIAPLEIVHTMDLVCFLPLRSNGTPQWKGDKIAEDFVIKLPFYLAPIFEKPGQLNAEHGRALAEWARGSEATVSSKAVTESSSPPTEPLKPPPALAALMDEGNASAEEGIGTLRDFWGSLTATEKAYVGGVDQLESWKRTAKDVEAMVPATKNEELPK